MELPVGQQMGLFTGKALNDTPTRDTASAKPVRFNEGEVGELSLGSVSVESYLREMGERDAFAVREVLSVMDFNAMESSYRGGGRPPYGPRQMLGLVLYGVMQGVSSLRGLERLSRLNMGCMWACGGILPDHSVLGRFVQRHGEELREFGVKELTREVLRRTGSDTGPLAGDGTVVQAAASAYRKLSEEAAQAAAEEAEREAEASPDDGGAARRAALAQEANETLRERIEARRAQSKSSERLAVSPTEPEAMRQPLKNKAVAFSYKPSVLANEARVVVAQALDPSSETGVLGEMLEQASALGEVHELMLDAGYHCDEVIEETLSREISLLCPGGRTEGDWQRGGSAYAKHRFVYDACTDTYCCPQGETLRASSRYRGQAGQGAYVEYTTGACRGCPVRAQCTTRAKGRRIRRLAGDEAKEALAQVMSHPQARRRFAQRKSMVEPVFSVLGQLQGLKRFRRRGLAGARLEFALHVMAYNLSRVVALGVLEFIWRQFTLLSASYGALRRLWRRFWSASPWSWVPT